MVVERIFISPVRGAPQIEREQIEVQRGMGVVGVLTLIEAEEIEIFCDEHGRVPDMSLTRRNLITRGVRLHRADSFKRLSVA